MFGVVLVSQAVGLVLAAVIAIIRGEPLPGPADIGWASVAGIAGGVGIVSLYHGLATSRISVVAPLAGVLAATIPVVFGVALEGLPGPARMVGIGTAFVAVVLVSRAPDPGGNRPSGVRFGLLAGVGFGLFNLFASRFSPGIVFGPLVIVRAFEPVLVIGIVLATRGAWRVPRSVLPLAALVGAGDMAGNAFFVLAAQAGRLDVAAVLSSLYPVTTIVLAAILLRERVTRSHGAGILAAGVSIALIAAG